ncbi:Superfamily II DNA or RNA helicase [Sphingobium sp. AP50]|nr:Superfamily II DNA or RNA helicase [Sphingobium sp. AP50]
MATLARRRAVQKPILIICPSAALVAQLEHQFAATFWDRLAAAADWKFPHTLRLTISQVDDVIAEIVRVAPEPVAVFSTIQALQQIHASAPEYAKLADVFGTVFFDEGHREPAPQWAKAARGLGAPTVLFSATPYRNDLKIFGVDQSFTSFLSFTDAIGRGLIRPVEVREVDLPLEPVAFAQRSVALRDALLLAGQIAPSDKVIIRADKESEVEALYLAFCDALHGRDDGVLAIHTNFEAEGENGNWKFGDVPEQLALRSERFLIHQHMLTEGIDDPSCRLLMIFSKFTNERQLVQQVGRLTRHPGPAGAVADPAYVFSRAGDAVLAMWERFLAYDEYCVENGGRPPLRDQAIVDRILASLPQVDYVDGQFRRRNDLTDMSIAADIRVPLSAVIFETTDGFKIDEFEEAVTAALDEEDRIEMAGGPLPDVPVNFHLSISLRQSPLLAETLFQTASVEVTAYAQRGKRLFFYDTRGLWMDDFDGLVARVGPRTLGSLLPQKGRAITGVTLRNTDLGPLTLRGRSFQAPSVARAGVFLGEQTHVVTRATGRPTDKVRRSLGFTSARVRQGEGPGATLADFSDWCSELDKELELGAPPADLFKRFATAVDAPSDTTPLNILVDMDSYDGQFLNASGEPMKVDLESACSDITLRHGGPKKYDYAFDLRIDENDIVVWIRWDAAKQKYWLSSRELSTFHDSANSKVTLLHRLNRQQPFRIILSASLIYAYRHFYSVDLQLGRPGGAASLVTGLLHAVPGLDKIRSEKGSLTNPADTWPKGSLFGLIDKALSPSATARPFGPTFAALVCDDIGNTEVADFIGVDDQGEQRVVFIPAKWKSGKAGAGASGLYDVSGQALKNLAYLKADGQPLPGAKNRFDKMWNLSGGEVPRRRIGPGSNAFRALFEKVRANPAASREVWLVVSGGILSKAAVDAEFKNPSPPSHVLQLFHLLLSLYAGCQSIGVDLKIFCNP